MNERKTILITGASSGFGRHCAMLFEKNGWNVIASMRAPDRETEFREKKSILLSRLDVTDRQSIASTVEAGIERFGQIDVLMNNAGFGASGFFEEASEEEIDTIIRTNFLGALHVTRAVLPVMRNQRSGMIINLTSIAGLVGIPMMSLYSASKFALEGFSESLRYELKDYGIEVRTIAPGGFKTAYGRNEAFFDGAKIAFYDEDREKFKTYHDEVTMQSPPRPWGWRDPTEVAELAYRLASGGSRKFRNPAGPDARMTVFFKRVLGDRLLARMLRRSAMP